jgi:hypothetical protein
MKSTLQPFFSMLLQEHKIFIVAAEQVFLNTNQLNF